MIWIKEKDGITIYRADTPDENGAVVDYKINSFSISGDKISSETARFVRLDGSIRYDEDRQFKVIKNLD
jgi:hypothetical protein